MLVRDRSYGTYLRKCSSEMADQNDTCMASCTRLERVHRFQAKAAMRHMPLASMHSTAAYVLLDN